MLCSFILNVILNFICGFLEELEVISLVNNLNFIYLCIYLFYMANPSHQMILGSEQNLEK